MPLNPLPCATGPERRAALNYLARYTRQRNQALARRAKVEHTIRILTAKMDAAREILGTPEKPEKRGPGRPRNVVTPFHPHSAGGEQQT